MDMVGEAVVYQGRVYRVGKMTDTTVNLVSEDLVDLTRGFTTYAKGVYVKTVSHDGWMMHTVSIITPCIKAIQFLLGS